MRTQSLDTSPEVERVMIAMVRQSSLCQRFRLVQALTQYSLWSRAHAWQERHPGMSEQEAALHSVSCFYGADLAQQVHEALARRVSWSLQPVDLIKVMLPVLQTFEQLSVPYALGGSIASSLYGLQQLAQDIDLLVDLPTSPPASLLTFLKSSYLVEEAAFWKAVKTRTSFSLLHLDSLMKIDIMIRKPSVFDASMSPLVAQHLLQEDAPPLWLASVYEMLLFKIQRYQQNERLRTDGMQDDAEWNDILGMLKVQAPKLDSLFLDTWATRLGVADTWQRAAIDAGWLEIQR